MLLQVEGLCKSFGDVSVINNLSFSVEEGEFLTILGSSGCGKTTLLRLIDGLETADNGRILLDGKDVTNLPPEKRPVNTVFQSYALFPHMTVFDNIAYPLRLAHIPKEEIKSRVSEILSLVRMEGFERRYPAALSGGQKQRIAIARSIIAQPHMLLLDEPLGALDFNLRRAMQSELKRLQKSLHMAFLYITHDQEEALNMSDRVAIMKSGHFLQIGTPEEIYDTPAYCYCAKFIGESNVLPCTVTEDRGNSLNLDCNGYSITARRGLYDVSLSPGETVFCALRGERIEIHTGDTVGLHGTVTDTAFVGGVQKLTFRIDGTDILLTSARYGLDRTIIQGTRVTAVIPPLAPVLCKEDPE